MVAGDPGQGEHLQYSVAQHGALQGTDPALRHAVALVLLPQHQAGPLLPPRQAAVALFTPSHPPPANKTSQDYKSLPRFDHKGQVSKIKFWLILTDAVDDRRVAGVAAPGAGAGWFPRSKV